MFPCAAYMWKISQAIAAHAFKNQNYYLYLRAPIQIEVISWKYKKLDTISTHPSNMAKYEIWKEIRLMLLHEWKNKKSLIPGMLIVVHKDTFKKSESLVVTRIWMKWQNRFWTNIWDS